MEKGIVAEDVCVMGLLEKIKPILIERNQRISKSGGNFNVFSILGVAHYENGTHSAFLAELLNPAGTHAQGSLFLKLFLDTVDYNKLDISTTKVKVEHHISYKTADTGGRIDIYLKDNQGNSICIENKIYAMDQEAQILRYCNHNQGKNRVYYLTLDGKEAPIHSKAHLIENEDYFPVAYKTEILEWLQKCINAVEHIPTIKETIKQYVVLIKKLTNTFDMETDKPLIDLMLDHYEEAEYIAGHFNSLKEKVLEDFRKEIYQKLKFELSENYEVVLGNPTFKKFSNLWIKLKNHPNSQLYFGIEGFNATLFIGVRDDGNSKLNFRNHSGTIPMWTDIEEIKFRETNIVFTNKEILVNLVQKPQFKAELLERISSAVKDYTGTLHESVDTFLNKV